MSIVSTVEKAIDTAIKALGDAVFASKRASISMAAHIPGQPPSRTAVFSNCKIAIIAMKVEDFQGTQIESHDLSVLDIKPVTPAKLDDRYDVNGSYYKVMFAKNTFAGTKLMLQELLLRPSDNGGLSWV